MCNLTEVLATLIAADVLLLAAMVSAGIALGINSTVFGAPGAVLPASLSVVSTFAAASLFGLVTSYLSDPACLAGGACAAERSAALAGMATATAVMAAATIAGTVALAASAVPVVGGLALGAFIAGLAVTALGIYPVTLAVAALQRCIDAAANVPLLTATLVVSAIVGLVGLAFIGAMGANRHRSEDDPFPPDNTGPIPD
jgi:hypothetical protein